MVLIVCSYQFYKIKKQKMWRNKYVKLVQNDINVSAKSPLIIPIAFNYSATLKTSKTFED